MIYKGQHIAKKSMSIYLYSIIIISIIWSLILTVFAINSNDNTEYIIPETTSFKEEIKKVDVELPRLEVSQELAASVLDTYSIKYVEKEVIEEIIPNYEIYTVLYGDNLYKIAKKFYDDGSFYPYIMEVNNLTDVNIIKGQVLIINYIDESNRQEIYDTCIKQIEIIESGKVYRVTTNPGKPEGNNMTYIGEFRVTGYDVCMQCCGKLDGVTASGNIATVGRTIAMSSDYSFGTKIYIEGLGTYVVEDRGGGIKGNKIDVFVANHEDAYALTGYYNAYIVEE